MIEVKRIRIQDLPMIGTREIDIRTKEIISKVTGTRETNIGVTGTRETNIRVTGTREIDIRVTDTRETGTRETGTKVTGTREKGTKVIKGKGLNVVSIKRGIKVVEIIVDVEVFQEEEMGRASITDFRMTMGVGYKWMRLLKERKSRFATNVEEWVTFLRPVMQDFVGFVEVKVTLPENVQTEQREVQVEIGIHREIGGI